MLIFYSASVSGVSAQALNTTAVRVFWTPVNLTVVYHYTVHYSMCGINGTVSFPTSASSGVVSGLQKGQQYQFSVTVTINVNGVQYTGGESKIMIDLFNFVLFLETSSSANSLLPSSPSALTYTSLLVALVVVGLMLLASLIGNVTTSVYINILKRRLRARSPLFKRCTLKKRLLFYIGGFL